MLNSTSLIHLFVRILIILVPSYLAAWLTGKMVYVVPTVAAMVFLASGLSAVNANRVDEDLDSEADTSTHKPEEGKAELEGSPHDALDG